MHWGRVSVGVPVRLLEVDVVWEGGVKRGLWQLRRSELSSAVEQIPFPCSNSISYSVLPSPSFVLLLRIPPPWHHFSLLRVHLEDKDYIMR